MDCAICLNHIERQNEAYLYPCCHFFCIKCITEWTERQRQHGPDQDCLPGQRCTYACPLCKTAYTYVVYECIGSSCRLMPTCGQPKTMSALPLSAAQTRRRALYVTPQQLAPDARQVPTAKRPRSPTDKEVQMFVQRELQAVLLAGDVDLIVQHTCGILKSLMATNKPQLGKSHTLYGDQRGFMDHVSSRMQGFLEEHSSQFAGELWAFLHSGLTVTAYDSLIFGDDVDSAGDGSYDPMIWDEQAAGRDW